MIAVKSLAVRWQRLNKNIDLVRDAQSVEAPTDGAEARDTSQTRQMLVAVSDALDALYDLWEVWSAQAGLAKLKAQDAAVAGDPSGEMTAALVFARGGKTHQATDFGHLLGYGLGAYGEGPYGASGWHWQPYVDQRYAQRNAWYASHLEWREVLPTLQEATKWLGGRPELALPRSTGT